MKSIILFCVTLYCITGLPEKCPHNRHSFYESLRILEIKVTHYDEKEGVIDYVFEGSGLITLGGLQITRSSFIGEGGIKTGKSYLVVYCADANHGTGLNRRNKMLVYMEAVHDQMGGLDKRFDEPAYTGQKAQ